MGDDRSSRVSAKKVPGRLVEFITMHFLRLNITNKLLLGFSSLLVLLVIISIYALTNLNRLNAINRSIVQTDLPVIHASEKMIDLILAQELYSRRYMVFQTSDMMNILMSKKSVFESLLAQIESVPEKRNFPVEELRLLHQQYFDLLLEGTKSTRASSSSMSPEFEDKIKTHQESFIAVIKAMASEAQQDQLEKTGQTTAIGTIAFNAAKVLCALGVILSIAAAMIITRNISGAIKKLNLATEMISKGEFDYKPDIRNKDELGDLAKAFVSMAGQLKFLEEMNLDTSPLTRLPGGTTIEKEMKQRIRAKAQIAFCLMDIDNFKAYNDHYGYARGNELIQATADIISGAVAEHGSENDFIGHIGGDDFVVITAPDNYGKICAAIVENFDKAIPDYYETKDRKRGHISGEDRQGKKATFPLATISIAVVTNKNRKSLNHIQFGEAAAEIKAKAKSESGSLFIADRRRNLEGTQKTRKVINIKKGKPGKQKKAAHTSVAAKGN